MSRSMVGARVANVVAARIPLRDLARLLPNVLFGMSELCFQWFGEYAQLCYWLEDFS